MCVGIQWRKREVDLPSSLTVREDITMGYSADRSETLSVLLDRRIIAVIRERNSGNVASVCDALVEGGIAVLELTLTTPDALGYVAQYAQNRDLCVGIGSALSKKDVDAAISAGARFVASPVLDPDLVKYATDKEVLMIPGAFTPTEVWTAWRSGADLVKLFPLPPNGSAYIRSILGPIPDVRLAPSGGVGDHNAAELLEAGAAVLNVGSWLMPDMQDLEERVNEIGKRAASLRSAIGS
jgi:2-dehydro-3-deoxyphosphogluconate aldolase/(4S)-4-hydroxy-2-oxoglutarate aldolase